MPSIEKSHHMALLVATEAGHLEESDRMIAKLDDDARAQLLKEAARAPIARRLHEGLGKIEIDLKDPIADNEREVVYLGRTSLQALGEFELHMFRDPRGRIWGRTIVPNVPEVVPGYFAVRSGKRQVVIDYGKIPRPELVPEGWPKPSANSAGLAAMVFAGLEYRLRGGRELLTGSVWRKGSDLGVAVTLVRSSRSEQRSEKARIRARSPWPAKRVKRLK